MTNLEREWRVGRQLALLTEPGEALPGFMGTGAGVVTKSGKFRGTVFTSALANCPQVSKKHITVDVWLTEVLLCSYSNVFGAYCWARCH